jgi:hypothetical protein
MDDQGPVVEPTLKVPAPGHNYVLIVVSNGTSYAASEIPRGIFSDPVLHRLMASMDEQMEKA